MRKSILFILLAMASFLVAFSQNTEWVVSLGGMNSDKGISIGTDSLGFIYASGYFNTSATFGGITLTNSSPSGNNKEVFLVKMDSTGNVLWAIAGGNQSGSCCDDRALGMHVTPDGYVFLTGTFWSSFYMGSCGISYANSHDSSLLVKIDPNGNCVWLRSFGADEGAGSGPNCPYPIYDADDHSYDVKVDDDGFIYITGFFSGVSAEFDNIILTNPNWGSTCTPLGYVAKLDDNGNFIWAHKFEGIKDDRGSRDNRIAIDHFSNVYVVGGYENTAQYGATTLTSVGEWDGFIFKMDADGNYLWAKSIGSNKTDRINGIAIDYCDNVYVAGEYRNPMYFPGANASNGTDTLSHNKKRDIFVAKITTNGDWVWAKRARSEGTDKPYQMSVDKDMQVYIGGVAGDSLRFTGNLVLSTGDTSDVAFVAQLDGSSSTASWVWAKLGGGPDNDDRTGDICEDGRGNVYAVGFYEEVADFDGTSLSSLGRKDIFVWKLKKANVTPTPSNCIYVDVQPPGAGFMIMNGTTVTDFPCLQNLPDSATQNFDAVANSGYAFDNWDWGIHSPLPNSSNPNSTVYTFSDDTLIINFSQIIVDTVVYITQPVGAGTLNLDGTNISVFPHTAYHIQGDTSDLTASANIGYTFTDWTFQTNTPVPNNTTAAIEVTWAGNDTVYLNFDTVPTYEVTFVTNLPGAGSMSIDGIPIPGFPYSTLFVQGSSNNLSATANPGFSFVDWGLQFNTAAPNTINPAISVTWLSDDTVLVNFTNIPSYNITYLTNPPGAGSLDINGVNQLAFPFTDNYLMGTNVVIGANTYLNFTFREWTSNSSVFNPSSLANVVDFDVLANDTIIANYDEMDTLWVITRPAGTAQLQVGPDIITTSPYMGMYPVGEILNISASPNGTSVFNQWDLSPATLPDYSLNTSFIFDRQDTLFASLDNVLSIMELGDKLEHFAFYPAVNNGTFALEMETNSLIDLRISLLSITGQLCKELYNGRLLPGEAIEETFHFDGAPGMYLLQVNSEEFTQHFKMLKVK